MQVAALFRDHQDLLEEFVHFLPDASAAVPAHCASAGRNPIFRERNLSMPTSRPVHVERVCSLHFHSLLLFADHPAELSPMSCLQKPRDFTIDCSDGDNEKLMKAERDQRRLDKERDKRDGRDR